MAKFDPDAFLGTAEPEQKKKRGFDPDAFLATPAPAPEKTTFEKFTEPLKQINVEDWKKESIAYPVLQTMYGLMPFQGKQGEQQFVEGMQGVKQKGDKLVQGVKTIAQDPGAAVESVYTAVTERPAETLGQMVKGVVYDPELMFMPGGKQASQAVGTAARATGRAVAATGRAVKQAGTTVVDVGKGFGGTLSGRIAKPGTEPIPYKQTAPVMEPAGKTHIPADVMAEYQASRITPEQAKQAAIPYTPEQIKALERTGGNVPYSGNVAQATGAILAEPYTSFRGYLPDLGLAALGGLTTGGLGAIGFPAANLVRKGLQAAQAARTATAANELGNLKFTPLSAEQRAALSAAQTQPVAGPVRPEIAPAPAAPAVTTQPVAPAEVPRLGYSPTPSVMYGSETGIVGKTPNEVLQADLAQRYAPQPIAPVAPSPMASQVTPEIQQATAQGIAAVDPSKQRILDMIKSANAKKAAETETTVTPVAPTALPETPVAAPVLETAPTRALTAAEIRRQLYPPRPGETPDAFEARVQEVLAQQPSAPTTTLTPSAEILAAVPDMARKTLPEIRFEVKSTGKAAITSKNNVIQLDKAVYDDLAKQYGVTLNWDELGTLSKGVADAREQVDKFVMDKIKEARGPEKRGPQQRTLAKQAYEEQQAAEQARLAALTPEQRQAELAAQAAQDAAAEKRAKEGFSKLFPQTKTTVTPQAAGTISPALQALLDKQKAAGNYRGPKDTSQMMTNEVVYPSLEEFNKATMLDAVAGKEQFGAYISGDKVIQRIPNPDRANVPEAVKDSFPAVKEIAYDAKTGDRVPVGQTWTEADPAPSGALIKERMSRRQPPNDVSQALTRVKDVLVDLDAPVSKRNKADITSATTVDTPVFKQVYASVDDFTFDNAFNEIRGEPLQGKFLSADKKKVIEVEPNPYFDSTDAASVRQAPLRAYDANTGERVPVKDTWTENDPAEYTHLLKAQKSGKPYKMVYEDEYMGIYEAQGNFAKTKRFKFEPDVKLTDINVAKTLYDGEARYKIYQGVNQKNGNVVEILIDSPDSLSRNGAVYEYNEYASGKLPKSLFTNVSNRQTKGKQVVSERRFVDIDDAGETTRSSYNYMED